jgi:hypothetical protein
MSWIEMLKSFRIRPILVFDGGSLPSKRATNESRREFVSGVILVKPKGKEKRQNNKPPNIWKTETLRLLIICSNER